MRLTYVRVGAVIAERGLQRKFVAAQLGVSPSMLSKMLTAEREWAPVQRRRVAEVLNVSEEQLFFDRVYLPPDEKCKRDDYEAVQRIGQRIAGGHIATMHDLRQAVEEA